MAPVRNFRWWLEIVAEKWLCLVKVYSPQSLFYVFYVCAWKSLMKLPCEFRGRCISAEQWEQTWVLWPQLGLWSLKWMWVLKCRKKNQDINILKIQQYRNALKYRISGSLMFSCWAISLMLQESLFFSKEIVLMRVDFSFYHTKEFIDILWEGRKMNPTKVPLPLQHCAEIKQCNHTIHFAVNSLSPLNFS